MESNTRNVNKKEHIRRAILIFFCFLTYYIIVRMTPAIYTESFQYSRSFVVTIFFALLFSGASFLLDFNYDKATHKPDINMTKLQFLYAACRGVWWYLYIWAYILIIKAMGFTALPDNKELLLISVAIWLIIVVLVTSAKIICRTAKKD